MPSVRQGKMERLSSDVWFGESLLSSLPVLPTFIHVLPLPRLAAAPQQVRPLCIRSHNSQVSQGSFWERFIWLMQPCAWVNLETVTLTFYCSTSYKFPGGHRTRPKETGQCKIKSYCKKKKRISKSDNGPWTLLKMTSLRPSIYFVNIFMSLQSTMFPQEFFWSFPFKRESELVQ